MICNADWSQGKVLCMGQHLPRHRGTGEDQKTLARINTDKRGWRRGDILRLVNQRLQSGVAKAPALLLLLGVAIFAAGALRYYRHGSFSLAQAGYCVIAVLASLMVLLVFDYTLHHAKIAAVMVLIFVALFLAASPAFCIGMGLGLAGMVMTQGRV